MFFTKFCIEILFFFLLLNYAPREENFLPCHWNSIVGGNVFEASQMATEVEFKSWWFIGTLLNVLLFSCTLVQY